MTTLSGLEGYELVKELGQGNFGVAKLMRKTATNELVAVKFLERGPKIDENVKREIINHRQLQHPNIVQFREVRLTPNYLAIIMEYAAGGELFNRVVGAGRFGEDEARYFFQQLVSGIDYCHSVEVCHRDLKLENTLLTDDAAPRLKICDFGYSKNGLLHSQPKSTVGTPAYIAPEVLSKKQYDGKLADVWSCGVTLYVMLVGAYPFEDPNQPRNFKETIRRIMAVQYSIPSDVVISPECVDLLQRVFKTQPHERISIAQIKQHPWFLRNLPSDLAGPNASRAGVAQQGIEDIVAIIEQARQKGDAAAAAAAAPAVAGGGVMGSGDDLDDDYGLDSMDGSGEGFY